MTKRRSFIQQSAVLGSGLILAPWLLEGCASGESSQSSTTEPETSSSPASMFFDISLAQWSLHKSFFKGDIDPITFPTLAQEEFGISAVEYVNQFFKDKATDKAFLAELNKRAADSGVKNLLIMCDGEGSLGATNDTERQTAVQNHYKWVEAAKTLGCHSIRVNAAGNGTEEEVKQAAMDGLGKLSEYASQYGLNVIVENHGGYSSDGHWLASVISGVGMDNCGTLPDFGNFCIDRVTDADGVSTCTNEFDRYKGVELLMPFAKGVSAKSHDFDAEGNEIHTDFVKMLGIVKASGYTGYIDVEYEGSKLSEKDGIKATKALLEKVGKQLS
ncbi:MAG: sugar phosphate isomerase/epimerase family protein [Bacteroidota bacterium]